MSSYLITLATGQQGRYVIQHLLAAGAKIHAVVRDPTSAAAQELVQRDPDNVTLFKGGLGDTEVFRSAAANTSGVFLNLPDPDPASDTEAQYKTARDILHAVQQAGVKYVVASTAMFTDRPDKWAAVDSDDYKIAQNDIRHFFQSKSRMEDAVRESGMDWTILHPAWLMGNYLLPNLPAVYPELAAKAELAHALADGWTMSHIDEEDVGRYGAAALLDPGKFHAKTLELGWEDFDMQQVANLLSEASGKPVSTRLRTPQEVEELFSGDALPLSLPFELFASVRVFKAEGKPLAEDYGIPLTPFRDYLKKNKERLLVSLPGV